MSGELLKVSELRFQKVVKAVVIFPTYSCYVGAAV